MYSYSPFDRELYTQQHLDYTPYKIVDWVPQSKLDINGLSSNPKALDYIINKYGYTAVVKTRMFHMNPNSTMYFENETDRCNWYLQPYWANLCMNPTAYNLIMYKINVEKNSIMAISPYQKVNWSCIPRNACMYPFLDKLEDSDKYDINNIALNPNPLCLNIIRKLPLTQKLLSNACMNDFYDIMPFIYEHIEKLSESDWKLLSSNKYAILLLEKNIDKIDWKNLSSNQNACHLIEGNLDKIDWHVLSSNAGALHILEKNIDKISWMNFLRNTNPDCLHIIERNIHQYKSKWQELCLQPNLISLLKNNQENIDWRCLSMNPAIFEIDYERTYRKLESIKEELLEVTWHPDKFKDWCLAEDEKEKYYSTS